MTLGGFAAEEDDATLGGTVLVDTDAAASPRPCGSSVRTRWRFGMVLTIIEWDNDVLDSPRSSRMPQRPAAWNGAQGAKCCRCLSSAGHKRASSRAAARASRRFCWRGRACKAPDHSPPALSGHAVTASLASRFRVGVAGRFEFSPRPPRRLSRSLSSPTVDRGVWRGVSRVSRGMVVGPLSGMSRRSPRCSGPSHAFRCGRASAAVGDGSWLAERTWPPRRVASARRALTQRTADRRAHRCVSGRRGTGAVRARFGVDRRGIGIEAPGELRCKIVRHW